MIYFFNNLRDKSHSQPADIIRVKYRKLKFWLWAIPLMVILALAGTYYHDIRNDWEFFENGYSKSLGFISLGLGCWAGFYWAVIFAGLFNREANR